MARVAFPLLALVATSVEAILTSRDNPLPSVVGDVSLCQITESLTIIPFNRDDFYSFQKSCEHYLLRSCSGSEELSVTVDFLSNDISSGRVGLRYGDSSVVSSETGDVVFNNLNFIQDDGDAQIFANGFIFYRESGKNRIVFRMTGNITVIHKYRGQDRSMAVTVTDKFALVGTNVPSIDICGLCGSSNGTLLQLDLLTETDIDDQTQVDGFIDSYAVETTEQYLRGQRIECITMTNDTVSGDPVFIVPLMGGRELCYDVRGEPDIFLNLISDKCTSVTADYQAMDIVEDGNVIRALGIKAVGIGGTCHNIEIRMNDNNPVVTLVDDSEISGIFESDGIRVRTYTDQVHISVPNCGVVNLIMWARREDVNGQSMLRFQVSRGYNLAPTSHGLIESTRILSSLLPDPGQFWNVPVTIEHYSGLVKEEYANFVDRRQLYLITVQPGTGGKPRTFLGEWYNIAWDQKSGPCYYVGDSEGGKSGLSDDYDTVIEGKYTDYQVAGLFSHDFVYTQFEEEKCV